MDRFQNSGGEKPLHPLIVQEFTIDALEVNGERRYALVLHDISGEHVEVTFTSVAMAQLVVALATSAVASCDDGWLTMLMVLLTETRAQSAERLFEGGHASEN